MTEPLPGAVVYAKDVARAAEFYRAVAGLTLTETEAGYAFLEGEHVQIVVVAIPEARAAEIEIADPPVRRSDTAVKLHFPVPSIAAARVTAAASGGVVDPPDREWSMGAFTACDGHDPEGNVIQVRVYRR